MPRTGYVNDRYVKDSNAMVHIEGHGYQFADGVYEVCEIRHGFIVDLRRHINRLERTLGELRIALR
jgi:D-alanine transaminase